MRVLLTPTPLIAIEISDSILEYTLPNGSENELLVLGEKGAMTIKFKDVKFNSIIGSFDKGKIDFDVTPFIDKEEDEGYMYYNYGHQGGFVFMNPNTSFLSLLSSHSLSLDKKYLIIKPKN